jgi:hypothetical protein
MKRIRNLVIAAVIAGLLVVGTIQLQSALITPGAQAFIKEHPQFRHPFRMDNNRGFVTTIFLNADGGDPISYSKHCGRPTYFDKQWVTYLTTKTPCSLATLRSGIKMEKELRVSYIAR